MLRVPAADWKLASWERVNPSESHQPDHACLPLWDGSEPELASCHQAIQDARVELGCGFRYLGFSVFRPVADRVRARVRNNQTVGSCILTNTRLYPQCRWVFEEAKAQWMHWRSLDGGPAFP